MVFDFDNTFFVYAVLFVIIMIITNYYFVKPFLILKEKRFLQIDEKSRKTKEMLAVTIELEKKCDDLINKSRTLALKEKEAVKFEALKKGDKLRAEADANAMSEIEKTEKQLLFEAWNLRRSMKDQILEMADMFTNKILERK